MSVRSSLWKVFVPSCIFPVNGRVGWVGPEDIAGVISFRFGGSRLYVSELVRPAPELL